VSAIRVLLADDDDRFIAVLTALLERDGRFEIVGTSETVVKRSNCSRNLRQHFRDARFAGKRLSITASLAATVIEAHIQGLPKSRKFNSNTRLFRRKCGGRPERLVRLDHRL
jgi:hypothetical protein